VERIVVELLQVGCDDGKQCNLARCDSYIIARKSRQPDSQPVVDHLAYTIDNWDKKHVEEVLRSRGLNPRPDTDDSFHVKDPDGYDLQIAGKNHEHVLSESRRTEEFLP
jgi:hypothetical protein